MTTSGQFLISLHDGTHKSKDEAIHVIESDLFSPQVQLVTLWRTESCTEVSTVQQCETHFSQGQWAD
jgi:hypothetical protein